MDSNIKAEIHEIKVKSTVENVEETQDLTSRKFEDQKEKLAQLARDHKKQFAENLELRHENNVKSENIRKTQKKERKENMLRQHMHSMDARSFRHSIQKT